MRKWIVLPAAAVLAVSGIGAAQAVTNWNQGFEGGTEGWFATSEGWYGSIEQVLSGYNEIDSATGAYHAVVNGDEASAPFSRFAGYSSTWEGDYVAEIDIYLDPDWDAGVGFDYSVAASGSDDAHQRDFIFHVTKDSSSGGLLVAGSNNTSFAPREDLERINHFEVTEAGWYTFQHVFRDAGGYLAVDLNLVDDRGQVLWTETRTNTADTIGADGDVGGNRYAWFTVVTVPDLAVDNHSLAQVVTGPIGKDDCTNDGWEQYGFKNQGQCVASLMANEKAGK